MTQARSLRVGDAERDTAVSALGEHFAAGRITKDEFDERSGRAWSARFGEELDQLFADLPQAVAVRSESRPAPPWGPPRGMPPRPRPWMLLMVPFVFMAFGGLLFLIISTAPWLLFVFFGLFVLGRGGRQRHQHWHGGGPRPGWGPPPRGQWRGPSRAEWRGEWRSQGRPGWGSGRPVVTGFGDRRF
ncbi:DUF1707 SHOCT-like domain-containing protein [Jiangella asiatica]|uniref:DUF1707 domain-containing protein n=1 Tax=Jiangella asiatica TaxID=2530372 RepID=A0A4V6PFD5_9ACTN|nr:DUF1707 domain-containing protein [Jiangella asiatica]TDE00508.1 DUF1707 domain-containing protein [Jiangella asiatica]